MQTDFGRTEIQNSIASPKTTASANPSESIKDKTNEIRQAIIPITATINTVLFLIFIYAYFLLIIAPLSALDTISE